MNDQADRNKEFSLDEYENLSKEEKLEVWTIRRKMEIIEEEGVKLFNQGKSMPLPLVYWIAIVQSDWVTVGRIVVRFFQYQAYCLRNDLCPDVRRTAYNRTMELIEGLRLTARKNHPMFLRGRKILAEPAYGFKYFYFLILQPQEFCTWLVSESGINSLWIPTSLMLFKEDEYPKHPSAKSPSRKSGPGRPSDYTDREKDTILRQYKAARAEGEKRAVFIERLSIEQNKPFNEVKAALEAAERGNRSDRRRPEI